MSELSDIDSTPTIPKVELVKVRDILDKALRETEHEGRVEASAVKQALDIVKSVLSKFGI